MQKAIQSRELFSRLICLEMNKFPKIQSFCVSAEWVKINFDFVIARWGWSLEFVSEVENCRRCEWQIKIFWQERNSLSLRKFDFITLPNTSTSPPLALTHYLETFKMRNEKFSSPTARKKNGKELNSWKLIWELREERELSIEV